MATYSPEVERWRPLVEKYFPPALVDKALYVIQGESGGNAGAVGDGGAARGLFQIQDNRNFASRPDAAYLDDPENNIRYAAQQLGAAEGKWSDWGEGSSYNGQAFGALGNNPYPGDAGRYPNSQMQTTPDLPFTQQEFQTKYVRYKTLGDQLANMQPDPLTGQFPPEYATLSQEYYSLELELNDYQTAQASGGADINGEIARLKYQNESNPALIDAENSANAWARQQTINQQATSGTQADLNQQRLTADSADASGQAYKNSNHFNQPFGFRVGSTDLPTEEELFAKQVARASANLPEVKPIPYSAPLGAFGKPAGQTSAPAATQSFGQPANAMDFAAGQAAFKGLNQANAGQWQGPVNPDPGLATGTLRPNPLNAPGLGQQFGSAFGGTALGQLGTMFGGGQNNLNLNNWPDTQAESDTLPPIQAPRPQPLQPSPLVQPFPNTGLRRFAGSILGSRY